MFCNWKSVVEVGESGVKNFRAYNESTVENDLGVIMASKTSSATIYEVEMLDRKIRMIDTPGFGDSRGNTFDEDHVKKIVQALHMVEYIDAIILVTNGRQAGISASLSYVLKEIGTIMHTDIFKNTVAIFTRTLDYFDLDFDVGQLHRFFSHEVKGFCLDNPYARVEKMQKLMMNTEKERQRATECIHSCFKGATTMLTSIISEFEFKLLRLGIFKL